MAVSLWTLAALGLQLPAHAQSTAAPPASGAQALQDRWTFNAGLAVVQRPDYPGSGDSTVALRPVLGASYGRWSLGAVPGAAAPLGVSYALLDDGPWRVSVGLGVPFDKGRRSGDSARAAGLGEVERTALGTLSASYSAGWFGARGSIVTDVGGHQQGTRALLDLEARYQVLPGVVFSAGPGITWADGRSNRSYFGVNAAQSAASGLAAYDAGAGVNALRLGAGVMVQLGGGWSVGGRISAARLQGDAASSPVTEQRTQTTSSLLVNYRF